MGTLFFFLPFILLFLFVVGVCVCAVDQSTSAFCFPLRGLLLICEPSLMGCFKEVAEVFMGSWLVASL